MIICTFFLTHCSLVQPANLRSSSLCLSEALCRRPLCFSNQMKLQEPAPSVSVQPHHRLRHPRLAFPRCAQSRWALSQLLSGWLWAGLQRSAGKNKMGHEKSFVQGGCQRDFYSLPAWEWRGVPNSSSFFFSADAPTGVVSQFALTPVGIYCPSELLAAACSSPILMCNLLFAKS